MSAISVIPRLPRVRPCSKFAGYGKFCRDCAWRERFHVPRFQRVGCSSCGKQFGAGNHGYSMCDEHANRGK